MKRFVIWLFRINTDRFRLDIGREIDIDGYPFVIRAFSANSSYPNLEEIDIRFESLARFKSLEVMPDGT